MYTLGNRDWGGWLRNCQRTVRRVSTLLFGKGDDHTTVLRIILTDHQLKKNGWRRKRSISREKTVYQLQLTRARKGGIGGAGRKAQRSATEEIEVRVSLKET